MVIDTEKCILCEACLLVCEDNAIIFEKQAEGVKIIINRSLCPEECSKCIDICPEDAISKKDDDKDAKAEYFIKYHPCDSCGKPTIKYNINHKSLCKDCRRVISAKGLLLCNRS